MNRIRANILGVAIDQIDYDGALKYLDKFISEGGCHYICVNSTQDIVISQNSEEFKSIVNKSDLATPDGWPVVWAMRILGYKQEGRVTGPDLMLAACEQSVAKGYSHYFYGGAEGVPELLKSKLQNRFPGLRVAGTYSPPFRPLTEAEDEAVINMINNSKADILWVGLSTPKQHFWIKQHLGKIKVPVFLSVGAAFDFHSGRIKRAPIWMQKYGLEWFHRILQEPKRLGKRYLEYLPIFALKFMCQLLRIKRYSIN